jgi:hypothetical protein
MAAVADIFVKAIDEAAQKDPVSRGVFAGQAMRSRAAPS